MLNLVALETMGKRLRKRSEPKREQQDRARSLMDALVAPRGQVSPAQAEHFVQFALQFLH